jgi:hypothetical protein
MKKKGALQISFAWLFAIIAGAAILFLAIFVATKIIGVGKTESDIKTQQQIGILLNPLESSFTTGITTSFRVPSETKIYNNCESDGSFGRQLISVSQKSLNTWSEPETPSAFSNKYIFSKNPSEGKKFYLFSKPFEMPFKVADLIYLTSDSEEYCLEDMPSGSLRDEIESLKASNPKLALENCSEKSIKVCFSSGECSINVKTSYVEKGGKNLYYSGDALMVAAIFSDPEVYECQIKRLMQRTEILAKIYLDKEQIVKRAGCDSNIGEELNALSQQAKSLTNSQGVISVMRTADEINEKNKIAICKLW